MIATLYSIVRRRSNGVVLTPARRGSMAKPDHRMDDRLDIGPCELLVSAVSSPDRRTASSIEPAVLPAVSSSLLSLHRPTSSFNVISEYDYARSTRDNYQDPSGSLESFGPFAAIRDGLDKAYHGLYTRARQAMQDELVWQVLGEGKGEGKARQANPWVVFTAGAMGAGKSHTIRWMAQRDIFPLRDIVPIDSDLFKSAFPEWPEYVARDPLSAGRQTRHESGYLVEIATEAALRTGKHVWVDGSLRDCEWYMGVFAKVRREHPQYQIAILYVTADEETVAARVRRRAELTGRHVPEAEILDSLARVPRSVAALAPCAHFLAVIDNSQAEPQLAKWCEQELCYLQKDRWDEIQRRFSTVPPPAGEAEKRAAITSPSPQTAQRGPQLGVCEQTCG